MATQTQLVRPRSSTNAQSQNSIINSLPQLPSNLKQLYQSLQIITQNSNQNGYIGTAQTDDKKIRQFDSDNPTLSNVFKRLARSEQQKYLKMIMQHLKKQEDSDKQRNQYERNTEQFNCSMKNLTSCLPIWNNITLKLNKIRKSIQLQCKNYIKQLYLREYLLRKSKVHPLCFVLQNIKFASKNKQYCIHIKFQEKDRDNYIYLQQLICKMIAQSQASTILFQLKEEKSMKQSLNKSRGQVKLFLTNKNNQKMDYFQTQIILKQRIYFTHAKSSQSSQVTSVKSQSQSNEPLTQNRSVNSCMKISEVDESCYYFQFSTHQNLQNISQNFLSIYQHNHEMVVGLKYLESSIRNNCEKYQAIYQKLKWNQRIYGETMIVNCRKTLESTIWHLMNIDHKQNSNFIQFLELQAKKISQNKAQIVLIVKFGRQIIHQFKAPETYLSKFIQVFSKTIKNQNRDEDPIPKQKRAKTESAQSNKGQRQIHSSQDENTGHELIKKPNNDIQHIFSGNFNRNQNQVVVQRVKISQEYLKIYHKLTPTTVGKGKIMKQHFLWNNWKRAQKGGLVCKDEQLVQKQKKMFKLVIKKFGQTLLMGKNIINFSLPVVVFKKDHLESLAKSYLYSPIFTERAAKIENPLSRMKFSVILMITENALSIHMEKPFNPILGQTFQGSINGCPIYLQQISHHPPISAYYLLGRGYKKYGCIQPKISVGLNTASGYSLFPHFVEFDDGMKIQYICAKMAIGGLLIGERTFNFEEKIYAYDRKHRYFASVSFGPKKKGFFGSSSEPQDHFFGFIYQVTPNFEQYFDEEKGIKPHPQPEHIIQKLASFDGIWNSFININGEEVLNFKTDLPYEFETEKWPLPSDSRYREDLSNLLAGDLEAAQVAKQEMQQLQRHDRKLREMHHN